MTSALAHRAAIDEVITKARRAVVEAARQAVARGWAPATSGNFSVRAGAGHLVITRSGADKGRLSEQDLLLQPLGAPPLPGAEPVRGAPRPALAQLPPLFDQLRLKADVDWLAAPEREGRGAGTRGLDAAADHIADRFAQLGLAPWAPTAAGRERFVQAFTVPGEGGRPVQLKNILGVLPGNNPALAGQALVISAHYDHLGRGWPDARAAAAKGQLYPGADDNASGVAVLLELARLLAPARPERSVIFAAFSGEEAGLLGARQYVRAAQAAGAPFALSRHIANLNVDTVGRLQDGKVAAFGAASAREWPFIFIGAGAVTGVPVQVVTQPLDSSDHAAFIEAGVPAVQLFASTAGDYHRPGDTADKIDVPGLAKVAAVLKEAADYLATRAEPLSFSGSVTAANPAASAPSRGARASTGIVPDMAFDGEGVRVASVQAGSGAEAAGLRTGDRVLLIGATATPNLRALSEALRSLKPGQTVRVEFVRGTEQLGAELKLGER